jgi:hypothetical protein
MGDLVKNASTTARGSLGTWSTTLFNGEQDVAGKTIVWVYLLKKPSSLVELTLL